MSNPLPVRDPLGEQVAWAFSQVDTKTLKIVATQWSDGNTSAHIAVADIFNEVDPDGLLVAALLTIEHPSVCDPRGCPRATEYGKLLKLAVDKPVDNSVDKCHETVDRSPFLPPVESLWIVYPLFMHKLSTAPCG